MVLKTLPAVLAGVSLCLADISGIVTDTGTTPIAGVAVQFEKGGQPSITGPDGHFTLDANSAILRGNGSRLPDGLSARISNNILYISIAEQSAFEVSTFSLTGRALSTIRKTLYAGDHSLSLPYQGAGIYVYRVKSGNSEIVLKGNSVGASSSVCAAFTRGQSSGRFAKGASRSIAINDAIIATKTGYLNSGVMVYNSDTTGVAIKMIASAGTVSDTDGNVYQTVKIGNQVWMAENLRVTKYNDGSPIPLDTSAATWDAATPKFCFYENTADSGSMRKHGALYNFYVLIPANPKKIAPAGWHVPSDSEWTVLEKYLVLSGHNWDGTSDTSQPNMIARSLAAKTDWFVEEFTTGAIGNDLTKNNGSGFSALPSGYRSHDGTFLDRTFNTGWWTGSDGGALNSATSRILSFMENDLRMFDRDSKSIGYSVRLVKDN